MKVTFLLARRVPDRPSPILLEVMDRLRGSGHTVDGFIPEDRLLTATGVTADADLYVLKSHTELALSYAGALADSGARVLNDYRSCLLAQDKVTAARRMRDLGVPTPDTWLTAEPASAAPLLKGGPLIVKPVRGHRGAQVHLVRTADELQAPQPGVPWIVQRHVPGLGEDLKVYVAGDCVWAVRKCFDPQSFTRPGRPAAVSDDVHAIAAQVREGFGLQLFGIDVIESPSGPQVVDVNYFPGYKGCDDPAPAIASVVAAAAEAVPLPC